MKSKGKQIHLDTRKSKRNEPQLIPKIPQPEELVLTQSLMGGETGKNVPPIREQVKFKF